MDKELLNGSGAKDPTPYAAMKKLGPQPGEIYKHGRMYFLVINSSQNGMYCPVLGLIDETPTDINLNPDRWTEVREAEAQGIFYTDASMLNFSTTNSLRKKFGSVTDEMLDDVRDAIADALGIRMKVGQPTVVTDSEPELTYKCLYEGLLDKLIKGGR